MDINSINIQITVNIIMSIAAGIAVGIAMSTTVSPSQSIFISPPLAGILISKAGDTFAALRRL